MIAAASFLAMLAASARAGDPARIAIYPGFEREELPVSVERTVAAARSCYEQSDDIADTIGTTVTGVAHLATTVAYGTPVVLLQREVERPCYAEPVTTCRYLHVWARDVPQLVHSTINCTGSSDRESDVFVVSATWDLSRARRAGSERRSLETTALWFSTTSFPGTELSAFASARRGSGRVVQPPLVRKFDSFATTDTAQDIGMTIEALEALSRSVHAAACAGAGLGDCDEALTTSRQPP